MSGKARRGLLSVLCLAVACTACHRQEAGVVSDETSAYGQTGDSKDLFEDVQYIGTNSSMNGTMVLNSFYQGGNLCFEDASDGAVKYVCSKAGCKHDDADSCVSAMLSGSYFPVWFGDRIYAMNDRAVYSCNTDGSDLTVCYEFEKPVYSYSLQAVRVGQMLYYTASYEEQDADEEGYVYTKSAQTYLYRTDLKTGETKRLYSFSAGYCSSVGGVMYSGSHILINATVQLKSIQDIGYTPKEYYEIMMSGDMEKYDELYAALERKKEYVWFDPQQEETQSVALEEIPDNMYIIAALENGLLLVDESQNKIWQLNMDTGDLSGWKTLEEGWAFGYSRGSSDGLMIQYTSESSVKYCIYPDMTSVPVCFCPPEGRVMVLETESESKYWYYLLNWNDSVAEVDKILADKNEVFESGKIG